jgi:hypothetical protein
MSNGRFVTWAFIALSVAAFSLSCGSDDKKASSGDDGISGDDEEGGSSGDNGRNPDGMCATAKVQASRIKPYILFVVDRSLSTQSFYPGSISRWQAMYDALMEPNEGLIKKLQGVAYFGMVLFDSGNDAASCPHLLIVEPKLDNYDSINEVYVTAGPANFTPTALALEAAYKLVPKQTANLKTDTKFVILCTDGEPNGCNVSGGGMFGGVLGGVPPTDYQGPIDQVTAAAKSGVRTYVIGISVTGEAQDHLAQLAELGKTGAPAYSPANKGELVDTLSKVVGGAISCKVELNGAVTDGKECEGYVKLNGDKLGCDDENGWKLVDENHIELQGSACESFMNDGGATVDAAFPCDVFTIY